jgi:hypothetical protein
MLDGSRRQEKLQRTELLNEIRVNDLIKLSDGDGIVHIVFPGTGTICRPKMIEVGTHHRNKRKWDILGSTIFEFFEHVVKEELKMTPCGHCLSWYR